MLRRRRRMVWRSMINETLMNSKFTEFKRRWFVTLARIVIAAVRAPEPSLSCWGKLPNNFRRREFETAESESAFGGPLKLRFTRVIVARIYSPLNLLSSRADLRVINFNLEVFHFSSLNAALVPDECLRRFRLNQPWQSLHVQSGKRKERQATEETETCLLSCTTHIKIECRLALNCRLFARINLIDVIGISLGLSLSFEHYSQVH